MLALETPLCCSSTIEAQTFCDFSAHPENMTTTGVYGTRWENAHGVPVIRDGILSVGRSEFYNASFSARFALSMDQGLGRFEANIDLRMWNAGRTAWG